MANEARKITYEKWVKKYGEDQAKYLLEELTRWTDAYSHGTLISFDFLQRLKMQEQVQQVCAERGWKYSEIEGDLTLLQKLLDGEWNETEFLMIRPHQKVRPTADESVIGAGDAD